MAFKEDNLIGQLLVQSGFLTIAQLEQALADQQKTGGLLGSVLVRLGFIDEEELCHILSTQFGIKYLKLKNIKISPAAIESVPAKFATHYKLIPIDIKDDTITVALSNPLDIHVLDDLKLLLKKEIETVLSGESDIIEAIKKYYGVGAETIEKITPAARAMAEEGSRGPMTEDISTSAEDASIIKFVNQILLEGYRDRATDIHIEPYQDELVVRYRVDGILYETKTSPHIKGFQSAIISRIKIMANLDIAERRLPQDGRIKIKIEKDEVDLRVSILPTPFGESVVIRVLSGNVFYDMGKLGLLKRDIDVFERLIKMPHGIIFVTGPTGSGKTTTLYAGLQKINDKEKKIITVEDPIEYQMKGVVQVQVHPRIGLTFANALRAMLRHDPDVMMVGEVRDLETAEITIRVALTGHLVFSTLHTNDASGGITRLIDMGIEPFLVASSVNAFIAQRLVRIICQECKQVVKSDKEMMKAFEVSKIDTGSSKIYQGKGCESCKHTGYKGRTAIYELLTVSEEIRDLILHRSSSDQIKKKAVSLGMRTLRQDGWEKIVMGITTPSEVIRVTQQEEA